MLELAEEGQGMQHGGVQRLESQRTRPVKAGREVQSPLVERVHGVSRTCTTWMDEEIDA